MLRVEDGRITDIGWKSDGCAASIAASSMVSELALGKPVDEAQSITREAVVDALGGLPLSKLHASVLAADALDAAITNWREKSTGPGAKGLGPS
jgi:nitrogen fixation NifU-like protein